MGMAIDRAGMHEERRADRSVLANGTLACPACDAPVALPGPLSPIAPLSCPLCAHTGVVRDFLSLEAPTRPAHVEVVMRAPALLVRRRGPAPRPQGAAPRPPADA